MNAQETRRKNTLDALHWINKFGWLRPSELGAVMWPHTSATQANGSRLATQLVKRQLVIERRLPEGAGRALVLSLGGCRMLAEQGISARSGKDVGTATPDGWIPSIGWRHDLLAHGVLVHLYQRDFDIWPEHELRRLDGDADKIPDGLARDKHGDRVFWIEVERARKSGDHMDDLAKAVIRAYRGQLTVAKVKPTVALVAYVPGAKSERGHQIDHRTRVTRAIAAHAGEDVKLIWGVCEVRGTASLRRISFEQDSIHSDRGRAMLRQLTKSGWRPKDGAANVSWAHSGSHRVEVWKDADGWKYSAWDGDKQVGQVGKEESISAAKLAAAGVLAGSRPS